MEEFPPGLKYQDFGSKFGPLFQFASQPTWQVHAAWETREPGFPHVRLLMTNAACAGDKLFRGEISVMIDVMHKRLKIMPLCSHDVAPVSVSRREKSPRLVGSFIFFYSPWCP